MNGMVRKNFFGLSVASWAIVLSILGLTSMGLTMLWSFNHNGLAHVPAGVFQKHLVFFCISAIAALLIRNIPYFALGKFVYPIFAVTLIMLAAVLIFGHLGLYVSFLKKIFPNVNGSYRWIRLDIIQVQPSEFLKITYILALARYLRFRKNYRKLRGLIGPFILTIIPMVLILLEPDLGTVMLLVPVLLIMLYAAGARLRHLLVIILLIICSLPAMFAIMKPYQRTRIAGLFLQSPAARIWLKRHPGVTNIVYPHKRIDRWYLQPEGYQLYHSKMAVGSGGIMGYGLSNGPFLNENRRLPHCHNDFIFAMIANQFGLFGTVSVILLYLILSIGLTEIAAKTAEPFGKLILVGTASIIGTQAMINIAMSVGMMPITGVTLPFVSYGGSSLLTYFILIGLALSVDASQPAHLGPKPFEFGDED